MVVWKSSPNGKSEPISRRNNSLLRNLNGSELAFVSCQVQSSGGWVRLQQKSSTLQMVSVPVLNPPKLVGPQDFFQQRTYLAAYSACAHPSSVICYGSRTQWLWFKSTPLHYDLGRGGGAGKSERCCQSWPEHWPCRGPTFSPLFLSLSAAPVVLFFSLWDRFSEVPIFYFHVLLMPSLFRDLSVMLKIESKSLKMTSMICVSIPPQCVLWQWETVWSVSKPNVSMAQRAQHAVTQPCPALCLEQQSLQPHRQVTQIYSLYYFSMFSTLPLLLLNLFIIFPQNTCKSQ